MLKRYFILTLTLALVFSLLAGGLLGCKAAEPGDEELISMGAVVPLSGAAAAWGLPVAQGWRLAVNEINEAGGIKVGSKAHRIEFRMFDSRLDAVEAAAAATKLIEVYNCKVMGIAGSGDTLAIQPISEEAKVFIFTQSWTDKQLGPDKKYSFRIQTGAFEPVSALYKWIGENKPGATIALTNVSYEGGFANEAVVKEFVSKYGLNLVYSDFYPTGTTDFTPMLTKIASLNPDFYDTGVGTGDMPLLVKQAYELGYRGRIISIGDLIPENVIQVAGKEAPGALKVAFQNLPWHAASATPQQKALHDKFWSEAGTFNKSAVTGYIGAMTYKQAAEATDSFDPDKIAEYLENNTFETPLGTLGFPQQAAVRYGINHQMDQPAILCQFTDTQGNWDLWFMEKPVWIPAK